MWIVIGGVYATGLLIASGYYIAQSIINLMS